MSAHDIVLPFEGAYTEMTVRILGGIDQSLNIKPVFMNDFLSAF